MYFLKFPVVKLPVCKDIFLLICTYAEPKQRKEGVQLFSSSLSIKSENELMCEF